MSFSISQRWSNMPVPVKVARQHSRNSSVSQTKSRSKSFMNDFSFDPYKQTKQTIKNVV